MRLVLALVAAMSLLVPSASLAEATASAGPAVVAKVPTKVRIVLTVKHCEGCTVTVGRGDEWGWPRLASATVRHRHAVLRVGRAKTLGMTFTVHDPHAVRANAAAMAVIRYPAQAVGGTISRAAALHQKRGYGCTAAVTRHRVHWTLVVSRVRARDFITGKRGYDVRAHFSPGVASYGDLRTRLDHGGIEVNGDFACATPVATLADFVGTWQGHTRQLTIAADGTIVEDVYAGCCTHLVKLTYRAGAVRGTVGAATIAATVQAIDPGDGSYGPLPKVGQTTKLSVDGPVITSLLTGLDYCSHSAPVGYCGA